MDTSKENQEKPQKIYELPYSSFVEYFTKCFFVEMVLGILFGIVILTTLDNQINEILRMMIEMGIFTFVFKIFSYKLFKFDKILITKEKIFTSVGFSKAILLADIKEITSNRKNIIIKTKNESTLLLKNINQSEIEKIILIVNEHMNL